MNQEVKQQTPAQQAQPQQGQGQPRGQQKQGRRPKPKSRYGTQMAEKQQLKENENLIKQLNFLLKKKRFLQMNYAKF